ncbi:aldo/keto reductase [Massilia norwichensis]|uniref:Aldo/keto reductase n=1 Tax=Massilia norwichensis TaxID=1442366 RepID=A0ABT2ACQ0_9BURK|nr:aldo/keto reductase [Massilia norwichensis]MCS0591986.1 aldo/keto reductase [Massilia norwichensis]
MTDYLLPSGSRIPMLGQGTWNMGEDPAARAAEVAALRLGLDLGVTLIDSAEMYGEGGAEEVVGEAIAGRRDEVFLVSKVYPHNADRRGVQAACERSLRRMRVDCIDLYLLHWRGNVPLAETLEAFVRLREQGKIRDFGVSNFDLDDMLEASKLPGGELVATDQVLYNLAQRGIEWDLLPWCRERRIPVMAYSPLESDPASQAGLLGKPQLKAVARRHGVTPAQVALAWLLRQDGVVVIPKAVRPQHVRENRAALDLAPALTAEDLAQLDAGFPTPRRRQPLAMR